MRWQGEPGSSGEMPDLDPFYRIFAVPTELRPDRLEPLSSDVQRLLQAPAGIRNAGFGFSGLYEVKGVPRELVGLGYPDHEVLLLSNGYFELKCSLLNDHFQWWPERRKESEHLLYPYPIQEMPLSFLITARNLYQSIGLDCALKVQQEYVGLEGFLLPDGHPGNPLYGMDAKRFEGSELVGSVFMFEPDFQAGEAMRQMAIEVYRSFGHEPRLPNLAELSQYSMGLDDDGGEQE
jgi:hypothetical protein